MGRPSFEPTAQERETVAIAAGGGMSHEEIALGIGIDRKTLEKHFEVELSMGAYQRRLGVIEAMHQAALKGNVAAQKAYLALEPALAAPPEKEAPKPGKKEQQQKEAGTSHVGTDWESDLRPRGASLN